MSAAASGSVGDRALPESEHPQLPRARLVLDGQPGRTDQADPEGLDGGLELRLDAPHRVVGEELDVPARGQLVHPLLLREEVARRAEVPRGAGREVHVAEPGVVDELVGDPEADIGPPVAPGAAVLAGETPAAHRVESPQEPRGDPREALGLVHGDQVTRRHRAGSGARAA